MAQDKNLFDYDPTLISDVAERFQNDSGALKRLLEGIDINNIDELSKMQLYYDGHRECADTLENDLLNEEIFLDTESAAGTIFKLQRDHVHDTSLSEADVKDAFNGAIKYLKMLDEAQDEIIQCVNQYRDYQISAGEVINNLKAYRRQAEDLYKKLNKVAPLLKDKRGVLHNSTRVIKRTDLHTTTPNNTPGFKYIPGKTDVDTLKKHICDSLRLNPEESSVQTFVNALMEADQLLKNKDISNIGWQLSNRYNIYVGKINNRTLTRRDVKMGADEIRKYADNTYDKVWRHILDQINSGDLSGASEFINNIQNKNAEFAIEFGASYLKEFVQNPIGNMIRGSSKKLDRSEAVAMWQDAVKHGLKLESYYFQKASLQMEWVHYIKKYDPKVYAEIQAGKKGPLIQYAGRALDEAFFSLNGKYYAKINYKFYQWNSKSKKFVPTDDPHAPPSKPIHAEIKDSQILITSSDSGAIYRDEKTGGKVHRFPFTTDMESALKKAGLTQIHTEEISGEKYICVKDEDYKLILPKLREQKLNSLTQKEIERHVRLTENSVLQSARQRLEKDENKTFRDTISRLSKGGYSIVFYDIETTGNKPMDKNTDIVQIGAVKYSVKAGTDGKLKFTKIDEFNAYIRPDHPNSKGAFRSHHIPQKFLAKHGRDKNEVISEFINFVRGQTYTMGFNNRNFDDYVLAKESSYFFENNNSFKTLDFRDLASLDYNKSFSRSRGTLEQIFNALNGGTVAETHNAREDAEMVANALKLLINQLNAPANETAANDQSSDVERKFEIQEAWKDSKEHRVEFDAASHKYKLHIGSKVKDVKTSVTSYISQFLPRSYDEKQFNSKMWETSDDLQKIYDRLARAIIKKVRRDNPGAEIPDFVTNTSEPFKYIDDCFAYADEHNVDTTTLHKEYVQLCKKLNETKPAQTDASKWGTETHEFIQAVEYYFAISHGNSFGSFVDRITNLYQHSKDGKLTDEDKKLLKAIKNSKRLPEESKNTLQNTELCLLKINSGALDNWFEARKKLHILDSQKVTLPPNGQQENHFVAKIKTGDTTQYVGASVDLIFENYKNDRMMLIDLKATSGSNAQAYGAQVSLYKQVIEVSEPVRAGKIDANVVYLPRVSNGRVTFDGDKMSNEEFIQNKMIANVNRDFTGMDIGELSEVLLDKIDPSWQENILGIPQEDIESRSAKFSYHTIGGRTFSNWADTLGNYVKYAFAVRSWVKSPQSTVSKKDFNKIEHALGIKGSTFDFEHIESYLSQRDKVCRLLKKYRYDGLAEKFRIAAGSVDKFMHNVLETYISNSSEGTESENASKIWVMAGSKHGDPEQIKLREALASIVYSKYGEDIKKEQQKLRGNKAREYGGILSDNAENILRLIHERVNQTFFNDKSFLALTDEEKCNKYVECLSKNFFNENNEAIFDKLGDTYHSSKLDVNGHEAYHFVEWLHEITDSKKYGFGTFFDLEPILKSGLKDYIKDCTSKDLVIDQLYNAAKYVARSLEDLFKKDYFEKYGEVYPDTSDTDYGDNDARVRGMPAVYKPWGRVTDAKYAHLENDEMPDVFKKNIYKPKTSERRSGELQTTAEDVAKQVRYELQRLTKVYISGMYSYLLAPPYAEEKEDQYWNQIAKQFGADFAELTGEYFRTNMDTEALYDFIEYIRHLQENVERSFGDMAWLSHILQEQDIDYSSSSIKDIYLKRLYAASNYKNLLVQQMQTYQTTTKAAMTKLAKMVSLHTTIMQSTEMTVGKIGNAQIRTEQRTMGRKAIVDILGDISKLISEYDDLNAELDIENNDENKRKKIQESMQKKAQKIAEKLRELLQALSKLREEARQEEKAPAPQDPKLLEDLMEEANYAADMDDDNDNNDRSNKMERGLYNMNMQVGEFENDLWRDIDEILKTLIVRSGGDPKFAFDEDKKSIEHFIKQFLDWQEWYGEDEGRKTSIALQLGALSGSNGAVRVTGEQVQDAFDEIYELNMTNSNKARKELNKYLKLFAEYCSILKDQGKENTFEFKDIINAFARNGYVFLDGTYQRKYSKASDIFQRKDVDIPKAIELFNDMIHLRTMLIEPLSVIKGMLLQAWGVVMKGEVGRFDDRLRRNFLRYLKSFYEVFNNVFNKFKDRPVKGTNDIVNKFSELLGLINGIDVNKSSPGMKFDEIDTCISSIIELAQIIIKSTITSNEHIVRSLEVYMEYTKKQRDLDDTSIDSLLVMEDGALGFSSAFVSGEKVLMSFGDLKTLILNFRNAGSDAPIYFSQNEFKNFDTEDYVFDEKTIKSLISKGIIKYDPEEFGYFLEGVRIPKEMLPADLRYSTKQIVINEERGDLMGQLDINGDINTILLNFFEGLQKFTAKMEEIVGNASGKSKDEGSKGASSEGESGKNTDEKKDSSEGKKKDEQKDSKEGKEALDNLRSYIDLLEKEKRILREIKNLESEKTEESVAQVQAKKEELESLRKEKTGYTEIAKAVEGTEEDREKYINDLAKNNNMSPTQKEKSSKLISEIVSKEKDVGWQDSPDKALQKKYESEMRDIYKERMESDDKEFRYMQAMQKAKDPSVKAAYNALIDAQKKKKEEILKNEEKTHARYKGQIFDKEGKDISEDIRKSLQAEDDTNRSVKMNEILSQNPPKTYASQLEDAIKGSVRTFSLFSIVTRIMYKFMNSLRQCVNIMKELDKVQMDLRVVTGNSKEGIQELTKSYSELGFRLGLTTKEVAESANTWLRQGYSISETNKLIEATAKLSKLGMVDAASASRYLTSAIKGFHMEASEAESVVDRLVTLDMKYAASAGDIAQALARVSAVAQSSNTSLNETTAMLTTMIDVSQQGAESVGDALKTMMSRFGNVKAGAFTKLMDSEDSENLNDIERVLNSIGITVRQSTMQMKSFSSVLDELYEKWDQLSNVEQNAIATAFAGQRQRNFFLLLMQNEESYRQALETTENAQGQAAEKYLAYMESYEYAAQQVKNAWEQITQRVFESDIFIRFEKGLAGLLKNLPTLVSGVSKIFAALSMYRAPTIFGNIKAKLPNKNEWGPKWWSVQGGIARSKEFSEKNSLSSIRDLLERIYSIMRDEKPKGTHKKNSPGNKKTATSGKKKSGKTSKSTSGGASEQDVPSNKQVDVTNNLDYQHNVYDHGAHEKQPTGIITHGGHLGVIDEAPQELGERNNGQHDQTKQSDKTSRDTSSGAQVGEQSKKTKGTNWFARKIRERRNLSDEDKKILRQQAEYAAILSGISTVTTGTSAFDWILSSFGGSDSWNDVKRTTGERIGAGAVSAAGTGIGAYFGGTVGAMAGSTIADIINTFFMRIFHYEEVQRLDRVKAANKIVDVLNSIDDSVKKATNAVSIDVAERTASDWQSIYKTRDEMQLAIYQLASEDIDKNGKGAFLFLNNFLEDDVPRSLDNAIAKLDGLTGSADNARKVMQDFGAAYQVAKAEAEYAALESEIEEINKKLGEEKYVLGQAYLDATTAAQKNAIAQRYAKKFPNSSVAQAAYAVQGEKARLRLNRENQYNTLLSAGLDASGMRYWNSYQIQNSAPDVVINNILEYAEKFLNDFGMTAQQNGEYTEEARKRAEAIVKKDEQLSNVYKQQATYYGRANRGVNRIQEALGAYNDKTGAGITMQQLKYMAKNYTAGQWANDETASALMNSLKSTLKLADEKEVLRDIDLLADNLTGNIRRGFLLSTEAAEKFSKKLEYVTSEDALGGLDKFLEKMSDLEKLMDEMTNSSGMSFESVEKVIKTYPWLLYGENGNLGTNNITGNLISFLGGNLSNSGDLVAQKAISELWSGDLGTSVWSQFASQVRDKKIGKDLPQEVYEVVTNNEYTTAKSAYMAIMKDLDEGKADKFNELFANFIKNIDLTEEYTAIYLKTIEKMNKWRTKMNENEISELESIKNNLSSVNSERERELKLIKAREALENAKNEKKRVYRTGKIMPLDNYIGQRPEVVKTEVRRFNRNRNDCRILLVTIVLKLSPVYRQYTV